MTSIDQWWSGLIVEAAEKRCAPELLAYQELAEARAEVERLNDLLWGARCVYCGEVVGRDKRNQELGDEVLRQHVRVCPKHPLVQAEAKLAKAVLLAQIKIEEAEARTRRVCDLLGSIPIPLDWRNRVRAALAAAKEER